MPKYNYWCLDPECENRDLNQIDVPENVKDAVCCHLCNRTMKRAGQPAHSIRPNYSGIENFGTPQYADSRRRACGMSGDVPPDTFHKDDLQ